LIDFIVQIAGIYTSHESCALISSEAKAAVQAADLECGSGSRSIPGRRVLLSNDVAPTPDGR
jgi:hypothetical protein